MILTDSATASERSQGAPPRRTAPLAAPILRPHRMRLLPAVGALAGGLLALTPSLLPREPLLQGLLSGVAAVLGYALFALIDWGLFTSRVNIGFPRRGRVRQALALLAVIITVAMLWLGQSWQQQQRADLGMRPAPAFAPLVALAVAVILFALLLVVARSVRKLASWLGKQIQRILPAPVASLIALVLVLWVVVAVVNDVIVGRAASRLDGVFATINNEFRADTAAPTLPEVSAGPGSSESWDDLGRQGRIFIANTPTKAEIADFYRSISRELSLGQVVTAEKAVQPIRVYVGNGDGDLSASDKAEAAVAELQRTGAFDRAVLNVATGTGRGWVNENQARALEYLWGGDTATVSIQYSHLPSWMSYMVDSSRAREAGQALFDAVYDHWASLPATSRPKLVVSGESLGSFGGEAAFTGASDLAARTDGALWVGPTAYNRLWQSFTENRDEGTAVYLPQYEGGETVRFSLDGSEWPGVDAWESPRVGYLQHANDPVTWLELGSIFTKPAILTGERAPQIPSQMIWIPLLTTLQIAVDQLATGVPDGQGHEFGQAPVYAWASILPPDNWQKEATPLLAEWMSQLQQDDLGSGSSS